MPVLLQFWQLVKQFVGDYKPTSLLTDLEVSATRAFIGVFGDVKVTICGNADRSGTEDPVLFNFYHMISAMPFVPSQQTLQVFESVFRSCTDQRSKDTDKFLDYIQDNFIGRTGGRNDHIPVHLWSQFEAVHSDKDSCCQSILLQGIRNASNTELIPEKELVWATIGRFGLEEELQAVRWKEALFEVQFIPGSSLLSFLKSAKTPATENLLIYVFLVTARLYPRVFLQSPLTPPSINQHVQISIVNLLLLSIFRTSNFCVTPGG